MVMIGTSEGIIKIRTVRRKSSKEERWNITQLENMVGSPWEPTPGSEDTEIKSRIRSRTEQEYKEQPQVMESEERLGRAEYRFQIRKQDVREIMAQARIVKDVGGL